MSLEDRLFPEDGSLITRLDNFMIKQARKLEEYYQNNTGKEYKSLVDESYKFSTIGFTLNTLSGNITSLGLGLGSYVLSKMVEYNSPIEEEIKLEISNSNKNAKKYLRLSHLFFGTFITSVGICAYNNSDLNQLNLFEELKLIGVFVNGISFYGIAFAEYLSKSGLPKPPMKTEKEKQKFGIFNPDYNLK